MATSGQFQQTDFYDNVGGLNVSDSPFSVKDGQATGGANYDYTQTGGFQKRNGNEKLNTTPDTELVSRGTLFTRITSDNSKSNLRAAGRKIQLLNVDAFPMVNLTEDTLAASSDVFAADTAVPAVFTQFNSATVNLSAFAGDTPGVYAAYSSTKFTKLGADPATGVLGAVVSTLTGSWAATGNYYYAIALRKASTQVLSNAALDVLAVVANVTDKVTLDFTTLTGLDTTKYDQIYIYRSAVGGASAFTTGTLVAQVASSSTSYVDLGNVSVATAQVIARSGNTLSDNGALPAGTYNVLTTWKRRLVTAKNNTLYISELNQPEGFPAENLITIPSGGEIKGLGIISFNTDFGNDEYLAVFQDRKLWLVKGDSIADWSLSFIDDVGCANQSLIVTANGYLTWIDYRGIYLWDGAGKPIYASRPIEVLFGLDGDLDKAYLSIGHGAFFRKKNQVIWFLSHKTFGVQKFAIKMDLRLTLPAVETTLSGRILDGVYMFDEFPQALYASGSFLPSGGHDEKLLVGDDAGFIYNSYNVYADGSDGIDFEYMTKFMDMGNPNQEKEFKTVIVWVEEIGNWNLTLDYWAGYRSAPDDKSTISLEIAKSTSSATALWDVGFWDIAEWNSYTTRVVPIVYHLNNLKGNSEGDCLRLRFRNSGANQPISIKGFSVVWALTGRTK